MKTGEFAANRLLVAMGALVAVALVGAMVYITAITTTAPQMTPANAVNIIKAARAFTHDLRASGKAIPASVPLNDLVGLKYLDTSDAAPFSGLDTTLYLVATNNSPKAVLLRVRLSDGSQTILFADGTSQQVPSGAKAP